MKIGSAVKALKDGHGICRKSWRVYKYSGDPSLGGTYPKTKVLKLVTLTKIGIFNYTTDGHGLEKEPCNEYSFTHEDILAYDWEID